MKPNVFHSLVGLTVVLFQPASFAAEPQAPTVEGVWKWTFTMPDGSQVTPRLEIKDDAGRWTGVTRLRQGTDAAVTNLTVNGDQISFEVARERDGGVVLTRYSGIWNSNTIKGKIVSNWTGEERTYDWEAKRSADATGAWKWSAGFGGPRAESRVTLKQEGEKLTGKYSSSRGGEIEVKRGKIKNGEISFEVERERDGEVTVSRYYGTLSGNKIVGKSEANFFGQQRTNTWEAVRAD